MDYVPFRRIRASEGTVSFKMKADIWDELNLVELRFRALGVITPLSNCVFYSMKRKSYFPQPMELHFATFIAENSALGFGS